MLTRAIWLWPMSSLPQRRLALLGLRPPFALLGLGWPLLAAHQARGALGPSGQLHSGEEMGGSVRGARGGTNVVREKCFKKLTRSAQPASALAFGGALARSRSGPFRRAPARSGTKVEKSGTKVEQ